MEGQYLYICGTLNNWTEEEYALLIPALNDSCTYYVVGKEIGKQNGTPHLHIYAELMYKQRMTWVKHYISARAHWEPRHKSGKQAADYCKKDGDFIEYGEMKVPHPGTRKDIVTIRELVKAGKDDFDIIEQVPSALYHLNYIDQYRALLARREKFAVPDTYYVYGAPGSGKTYTVYKHHDKDAVYRQSDTKEKWMDGYTGQRVWVLDDFTGQTPINLLLERLDRYQPHAEVKGGSVVLNLDKIYIISNYGFNECMVYAGYQDAKIQSLKRRIKHFVEVPDCAAGEVYDWITGEKEVIMGNIEVVIEDNAEGLDVA